MSTEMNWMQERNAALDRWGRVLAGTALLAAVSVGVASPAAAQTAVEGGTVYTMDGDPIENGVVLVNDGVIEEVGPAADVDIPNDYETLYATVVTPGFIDARSVVGLNGIYNEDDDQDALEPTSAMQPELRAFDAYDPTEDLVTWLRDLGITTVHTGHAPGALASGQTMVVKTHGNNVGEAIVDSVTSVAMTLGPSVSSNYGTPGSRAKGASELRQELHRAQEYLEEREDNGGSSSNIRQEILADVLEGEVAATITAQRHTEIMTALRIIEEFELENVYLDGLAEGHKVLDEIAEAGFPVFVHPTMIRPSGEAENASFEMAAMLEEAGVPFAFQSGFEGYVPKTRVAHFEAAVAVANGLDRMRGLEKMTVDAAEILGIDDRVGTLAPGMDADLALFDGDPFEYTTRTCEVLIEGEIVSDECL